MDIKALDNELARLIDKKMELAAINYDHEKYDDLEEEIHDMEDDLQEKYGDYLEDALHEVHDEFCPDSDVLLPIAYIPNKAKKMEDGSYAVPFTEGVYVDVDDYAQTETKLVLLPRPLRIILQIDVKSHEVVWRPKKDA